MEQNNGRENEKTEEEDRNKKGKRLRKTWTEQKDKEEN